MTASAQPLLLHTDELYGYHLGRDHPMAPDRVHLAMQLADYWNVVDCFELGTPPPTSDELLTLVHSPDYLTAARAGVPALEYGIGTDDNPAHAHLADVAGRIVSATVAAADAVWSNKHSRAVNLSGGLHHAFSSQMSGFCMFNDAAVAIRRLQERGAQRIAYLDLDAHHGDGVEQIFWDDPQVLTISVHESGLYLFPGTGHAHDIGGDRAAGTAVNIALSKNASDDEWLQTTHSIIPLLLAKFRPEILITQHGADPHRADPLADLNISMDAMGATYRSISAWVDRYCSGRWVALGGGGYQRDSVARAWTHVLAAVAGVDLDATNRLPPWWSEAIGSGEQPSTGAKFHSSPVVVSEHMGDEGIDSAVAKTDPFKVFAERPCPALTATSRAIFPYWGLVPYQ